MNDIIKINKNYYDQLYKPRNPFLHFIYAKISFDQQSKAKPNRYTVLPIINQILSEKDCVRILDYGSGWGSFLLSLPRNKIKIHAYDISSIALEELERCATFLKRKIHLVKIETNGQIFPNGFDIVLCSHVLEHVSSEQHLLRSIAQALRPGGFVLINVPINEIWKDPKHAREFNKDNLVKEMVATGLRVLSAQEIDRFSSFLLKREIVPSTWRLKRICLRGLRVILALLPYSLLRLLDSFFTKEDHQQLLVLGLKPKEDTWPISKLIEDSDRVEKI